jgi:hypothetical protein
MNASDIVKAKQCGALYKAYYNPTILQGSNGAFSTIISTVSVISTTNTGGNITSSTSSCINTVYPYTCNQPLISYELGANIECGKYVCGGKVPSVTVWKANRSMGAIRTFGTSTLTTSLNTSTLSSSANLFAVRPLICPDPVFVQGTSFQSQCDVCNNFGAGVNACCHSCASGQ